METVLKVEGLSKIFPKVVANDNISFELKKGEIVFILGENGAGKSTLMNCLCGIYHPTKGDIYIKGKKVKLYKSEEAEALGIGMVHQNFMLVEELTVAENVILGKKTGKTAILKIKKVEKVVQELSEKYGFGINPKTKVKDLSVGIQQRVEILKMLYRETDILIFDEATSGLTPQETKELFATLKQFVKEGKSILMITHKLDEVTELADRVVVLRNGKLAKILNKNEKTPKELANLMVGRELFMNFNVTPAVGTKKMLDIKKLTIIDSKGLKKIKNLSFQVKKGEIFGIAGVDGNGQNELAKALTGLMPFEHGTITIDKEIFYKLKPRKVYEKGVSHIPQERHERGLILDMNLNENLALEEISRPPFSKKGIIQYKYINTHGQKIIKEYRIKTYDGLISTKELSGGNQQKIILAREIDRNPKVLIAVQPTRGLDIGATEFIWNKLIEEKSKGTAVLLISTELEEILSISNRIAVIYKGEIIDVIDHKDANAEKIRLMMTGVKRSIK